MFLVTLSRTTCPWSAATPVGAPSPGAAVSVSPVPAGQGGVSSPSVRAAPSRCLSGARGPAPVLGGSAAAAQPPPLLCGGRCLFPGPPRRYPRAWPAGAGTRRPPGSADTGGSAEAALVALRQRGFFHPLCRQGDSVLPLGLVKAAQPCVHRVYLSAPGTVCSVLLCFPSWPGAAF